MSKIFDPLPQEGGTIGWLRRFVPRLERELRELRSLIPGKAPDRAQIQAELLNDPDFLDSIYRYIKRREERENG